MSACSYSPPRFRRRRTELDLVLRAAGPAAMFDVIDVFDRDALERLAAYADGRATPLPGFWNPDELSWQGWRPWSAGGAWLARPKGAKSSHTGVRHRAVRCSGQRSIESSIAPDLELLAHESTGGDRVDRVRTVVVLRAACPQHADDLAVDQHRSAGVAGLDVGVELESRAIGVTLDVDVLGLDAAPVAARQRATSATRPSRNTYATPSLAALDVAVPELHAWTRRGSRPSRT